MNKIEQQREHFENISEKYYSSRQIGSHLLLKDLLWNYFFKDKPFLKKGTLKVLEPMCGYAEGKDILERHLGIKIIYSGFDYSRNLVEKVRALHPALDVVEMDITKFVPLSKYDLIIIIGGLHHVPFHVDAVLDSLHGALNDDGYFIYFEPTHNNILFKKIRERIYRKNAFFDNDTERAFELDQINDTFERHNYNLIDQIYPGLLSYVLYYNPDAFPLFNIGGKWLVRLIFNIDRLFFRNFIGRKLSFATMSLYQKK
jgi:SAM-dependent methyltransferase